MKAINGTAASAVSENCMFIDPVISKYPSMIVMYSS
jgi:hypothetical protein